MATTDARPVPRKNTAFRLYFAIRKNDGTLITTWAGQDSEVSLDGAAFADCTNEATEIGTSGCGYLELTAAEMNADAVVLKITVTNTDALPIVMTFFPEEQGDYRVGAVELDSATQAQITAIETFATRMTTGLVQDGAVYQFTANMLELGPSGGGGGSGTGARTVTITVNDGATVLQNATIRMTEGANTFTALTDASGVAVFNLDDATYTVAVTKSGYTYAGTTMVVNGTETATYSMTVVSVTPPDNPDLSAVVVLCLGTDFEPESGVTIDLRIVTLPSGSTNTAYPGIKQTATSNGSGIATLEAPKGSVCEWKRGKEDSWTEITIGSDDQTNVTSIIGSRY